MSTDIPIAKATESELLIGRDFQKESQLHSGEHGIYVKLTSDEFERLLSRINNNARTSQPNNGIANPGPLGLAAFALTTFMLSCFNAGSYLIDVSLESVVLPVALFYGGMAQFVAGMWEYRANNTFGATAFTSYGAFWMSYAGYVYFIIPQIAATNKTHQASGLFLLAWFIFTLYMNIAAFRISRVLFILFSALSMTFLLLTIGSLARLGLATNIGGWFGIATAFIAWYASAGVTINSTFGRNMVPMGVYQPKTKSIP